ncbi:hypothetical protein KIH86_23880 [Paenibacillus sp. HN-1]|uniref:hypothetical protein n=1 Tax=Paenibacillus TaxID=44249 RepID=UPI001CA84832|nr:MULTISPECIES: hypothetical protein [Paenibacillus]MBY9081191.1 hypothetical protein [Paenibacillus sp. CGMCC 1.18879]MBY9087228.1 hypothetical protein [Paenibacillus sinensis]
MATPTGYGTAIRDSLVSKGVKNSDIGYNSNNGYITVGGSDFMKPSKVLNGVSYDTSNNFNNAWANYQKSVGNTSPVYSPKNTGSSATASGVSSASSSPYGTVGVRNSLQASGYNPSSIGYQNGVVTVNNQPFMNAPNINGTTYATPESYNQALSNYRINDLQGQIYNNMSLPTNQYTSQIDNLISQLQSQAQTQSNIDAYSTPEYAAYQAQSDRRANEGTRAAQESLGSSGFGRSTMLSDRAQGIQNGEREYLETQVVPQILANEQAKRQQEYNNLSSLLTPLANQQSVAESRAQTEMNNRYNALNALTTENQRGLDNRRADAALTGYYLTPQQQTLIDSLYTLKQQAEQPTTTKDQRTSLSSQADNIRSQLQASGLDISSLGANTSLANAIASNPGRTLQGQALDDQEAQQAWENRFNYGNAIGQFSNGQKTLESKNQAFNQNVTMAQLTGYLPDGTPTSEQQQIHLQNLWTVAQQTGVIPDALATLYGLPKGTQTQDAYQFAVNSANDSRGLDISQYNAKTSRMGTESDIKNSNDNNLFKSWEASGTAPAGLEAYGIKSGTPWYEGAQQIQDNQLTASEVLKNIKDLYTVPVYTTNAAGKQVDSGKTQITKDPTQRKAMFNNVADAGLSDAATMQVLSSLGFSKEEIQKYYDEGIGSGEQ